MKCLRCGARTDVTTTYQNQINITRRRRECLKCGFRFTTRETPDPRDVVLARMPESTPEKPVAPGAALAAAWHTPKKG